MKVYVCIKQVPDTETKIKLSSDKNSIDGAGVKWVMNPYDEFAVEEALKLKQGNAEANITILSLGPKSRVVDSIRTGLAMGADDGIVIDAPDNLDCNATAKALAKVIQDEGDFAHIFTGKLAIDDNAASVSQMMAEYLGVPHATVVSKFEKSGDSVTVEREVEGGTKEVIQLNGPSIVGANKGLNTPRYASLPGIMKAKKKPLKEISYDSLGFSAEDIKIQYTNFELPPEKPPVKMLDGEAAQQASELAKLLREEAKVL